MHADDHRTDLLHASARSRAGTGTAILLTALSVPALAGLAGCGGEPPSALDVGPVSWTESDLLGLSEARRRTLADLAALGLSVADSSTAALGAPLVGEWVDDRRIEILAAELTREANDVGDDVLEARYLTDPHWPMGQIGRAHV